jgi:hypothetical protein
MFRNSLILIFLSLIILIGVFNLSNLETPILIKSFESKTIDGGDVYNQIRFIQHKDKDIWMMNQSHYGVNAKASMWDRLMIIVDKKSTNKTARFYQLPPGQLEYTEGLEKKEQPFRISCFFCHSNGPRLIRPNPNYALSFKEKMGLLKMNIRIKTYGVINYDKIHDEKDKVLKMPFRWSGKNINSELKIESCTRCHSGSGLLHRNKLTRQQSMTIDFMVKAKQMPPPGFTLTQNDRIDLQRFLSGL